jgi:hypothetical protein
MREIFSFALLSFVLAAPSYAQRRIFDWTRANDESVQLDPSDCHMGRVYHPAPEGGTFTSISKRSSLSPSPLSGTTNGTIALQHSELMRQLEFRCLREHVVSTTCECHLPSDRPMVSSEGSVCVC